MEPNATFFVALLGEGIVNLYKYRFTNISELHELLLWSQAIFSVSH